MFTTTTTTPVRLSNKRPFEPEITTAHSPQKKPRTEDDHLLRKIVQTDWEKHVPDIKGRVSCFFSLEEDVSNLKALKPLVQKAIREGNFQTEIEEIVDKFITFYRGLPKCTLKQRTYSICNKMFIEMPRYQIVWNELREKLLTQEVNFFEYSLFKLKTINKPSFFGEYTPPPTLEHSDLCFQFLIKEDTSLIDTLSIEDLNEFSWFLETYSKLSNLDWAQNNKTKIGNLLGLLQCKPSKDIEDEFKILPYQFFHRLLNLLDAQPSLDSRIAKTVIAIEDAFACKSAYRASYLPEIHFYDECQRIFEKHPPALNVILHDGTLSLSHYQNERLVKESCYLKKIKKNKRKIENLSLQKSNISKSTLLNLIRSLSRSEDFFTDLVDALEEMYLIGSTEIVENFQVEPKNVSQKYKEILEKKWPSIFLNTPEGSTRKDEFRPLQCLRSALQSWASGDSRSTASYDFIEEQFALVSACVKLDVTMAMKDERNYHLYKHFVSQWINFLSDLIRKKDYLIAIKVAKKLGGLGVEHYNEGCLSASLKKSFDCYLSLATSEEDRKSRISYLQENGIEIVSSFRKINNQGS